MVGRERLTIARAKIHRGCPISDIEYSGLDPTLFLRRGGQVVAAILFMALVGSALMQPAPAFAGPLDNLPGTIPLRLERQAASDLIDSEGLLYEGRALQPDEARELLRRQRIRDLSDLDPAAQSRLWKNAFPQDLTGEDAELDFSSTGEVVEFVADRPVRSGTVMMVVQKADAQGRLRTYRLLIDGKGHNILARKTLLRKIGYFVPPSSHVRKVKIKFRSRLDKKDFTENILKRRAFNHPELWIAQNGNLDDEFLTMQDLIVFDGAADWFLNLSRGQVDPSLILGRRLLNSLLIPFSMTDAPESLNLMAWSAATVIDDRLFFPFIDAAAFSPTIDDARWITRRILRLTRKDWEEVAQSAGMPSEPTRLFLEKLISKRDNLIAHLSLEEEFRPLGAHLQVSYGERLAGGKLVGGRTWPGYARNFAGPDPTSPLNQTEVTALIESKFWTNVINHAINEFNTRYVPRTDLGFKIFDHQLDLAARQFADYLITKKPVSIPTGVFKVPYYNSNIILSREVVAGNYLGSALGSANYVQLADTLGFAVEAGRFFWGDGLPSGVTGTARAKVQLVLTYTHLKPIRSIAATKEEKLSKIIVPAARAKLVDPLERLIQIESRMQNKANQDQIKAEINQIFETISEYLGPGESYIVNTSLAPSFDISISKNLSQDALALLHLHDRLVGIHRYQILRINEKTFHVYIDHAGFNELAAKLQSRLKINILELGFTWPKGKMQTHFFRFDLDKDQIGNSDFFDQVHGVLAAVQGHSKTVLERLSKPWRFEQNFSQSRWDFNLLAFKNASAKTENQIRVQTPEGKAAEYSRHSLGVRRGVDFESLTFAVANAIIEDRHPQTRFRLGTRTSGNPGDTIFGSSLSREVISESRVLEGPLDLDRFFASVNFRWKGWRANRLKIDEILNELDKRFQRPMFRRSDLNETKALLFYSVDVRLAIYQRAIEYLLTGLTDKEVYRLYERFGREPKLETETGSRRENPWAIWTIYDLRNLRKAHASSNSEEFSKSLAHALDTAENQLEFEGFIEFVGGLGNIYASGYLSGFRDGAENATSGIAMPTIGEPGSLRPNGPIAELLMETGVPPGQFLLHWLLNPL